MVQTKSHSPIPSMKPSKFPTGPVFFWSTLAFLGINIYYYASSTIQPHITLSEEASQWRNSEILKVRRELGLERSTSHSSKSGTNNNETHRTDGELLNDQSGEKEEGEIIFERMVERMDKWKKAWSDIKAKVSGGR
ncbi:hypothetical protein BKA69DRAFT_1123549 [Paraphysoderma sedebokerense]|nr:hypothetical protein BKA69DRAFT_1123549 [Paraphysoderma sedebokerense]